MKKIQIDMPGDMAPTSTPLAPFNATIGVAVAVSAAAAAANVASVANEADATRAINVAQSAINPAVSAAVASTFGNGNGNGNAHGNDTFKSEDRRQNGSYFASKPVTQTIPVKLPDNIIELLKGQARQRGVSLQTLIKSTLAASVSATITEEQS